MDRLGYFVGRHAPAFTRISSCGLIALTVGCTDPGDANSGSSTGAGTGIASLDSGSGTTGSTPSADGQSGASGEKFDILVTDMGTNPGDCAEGGGGPSDDIEFSYIWIANSPAGTVSKIDTMSGTEVARYFTGPTNGADDPSRTSVSLSGDVAVTNRAGGITKIVAREAECIDANGNGTIETSDGPMNVLPFGDDECVHWHVPLPGGGEGNQQGPRPTAWDAGATSNPCLAEDFRVWVGYFDRPANAGHFYRLSGIDGEILDEVEAPGWSSGAPGPYGPYGGAVDIEGNFWVTGLRETLVRIDGVTLDVEKWDFPSETQPYGMTLDANGHVWTAGLGGSITHFDPTSETFEVIALSNGGDSLRGLQIDRNGQLWAAVNGNCGLAQFDVASRTIVNPLIPLPGCVTPVGVSIDVDGHVWVPDQGANLAYKVEPTAYTTTTTTGLIQPYTYSDMTGAGLGLVFNPPAG